MFTEKAYHMSGKDLPRDREKERLNTLMLKWPDTRHIVNQYICAYKVILPVLFRL